MDSIPSPVPSTASNSRVDRLRRDYRQELIGELSVSAGMRTSTRAVGRDPLSRNVQLFKPAGPRQLDQAAISARTHGAARSIFLGQLEEVCQLIITIPRAAGGDRSGNAGRDLGEVRPATDPRRRPATADRLSERINYGWFDSAGLRDRRQGGRRCVGDGLLPSAAADRYP